MPVLWRMVALSDSSYAPSVEFLARCAPRRPVIWEKDPGCYVVDVLVTSGLPIAPKLRRPAFSNNALKFRCRPCRPGERCSGVLLQRNMPPRLVYPLSRGSGPLLRLAARVMPRVCHKDELDASGV